MDSLCARRRFDSIAASRLRCNSIQRAQCGTEYAPFALSLSLFRGLFQKGLSKKKKGGGKARRRSTIEPTSAKLIRRNFRDSH